MQDFIFDIYKYAQLIPACKEIVESCYNYSHKNVKDYWNEIQDLYVEYCQSLAKYDSALANRIIEKTSEACSFTTNNIQNFNRMGDILSECIPLLTIGMKYFSNIDVKENSYNLVSSKSGFLSLQNLDTKHIYNSLDDPLWEARIKANGLYMPNMTSFHFAGCDLGYLAWEMFCLSNSSLDIYIYHYDSNVVDYAINFGVLSWIPEDKLHIIVDKKEILLRKINQIPNNSFQCGFVLLQDFSDTISKEDIISIKTRFASTSADNSAFKSSEINFWRNILNVPKTIYDIPSDNQNKDWMVIVAGPSLDDKLNFIIENRGKYIIIAATTVYKKLLQNNIIPNYIVVCDHDSRTYGHMDNVSCHEPVLLIASTATWEFGEYYKGLKYLLPCTASISSINYYNARGIKTIPISGTVAYAAVQAALILGASKIHLIGLDLAYPGLMSHAKDTMDNKKINEKDMILVPCVSGGNVKTTLQFQCYIKSMETLFLSNPNTTFINHSSIGANFKGTIPYSNDSDT